MYIIELVKNYYVLFLKCKKRLPNLKSLYGVLIRDFLINNCPCSVKLFLTIRGVNCKIEIVNSKENCFIFSQIRGNKVTIAFLILLSSLCNFLYVYYFFIVGAYIKISYEVNRFLARNLHDIYTILHQHSRVFPMPLI